MSGLPVPAIDTPLQQGRISTPPQSGYLKRNHSNLESPTRPSSSQNLLLSPAFSSPQRPQQLQKPVFGGSDLINGQYFSGSINSPFLMPNSDPLSGFSQNETITKEMGSKKKKQKKSRQARDAGFSISSSEKPPYSYATLIGMSILSHPDKQLTLSQIYMWISETFKYYRREDVGWQNSIRHNLSLNKAFVKGAKSKDGKGHFWCIESNSEDLFLKAKNNKKSSYHEVMDQLASAKTASLNSLPSSPTSLPDVESKKRTDFADKLHLSESLWEDNKENDTTSDTAPDVDASLLRTPCQVSFVAESPNKPMTAGKNLSFASSFSCSSNFELSPIPPLDTGPLLEPLTPAQNRALTSSAGANLSVQLPTISVSKMPTQHLPQLQPPMFNNGTPRVAGTARTPKSTSRTPMRLLRTPMSGNMINKLWHSQSYLEEFNYSPFAAGRAVLNSYDDDDMIMRAFDSPIVKQSSPIKHINAVTANPVMKSSKANLLCELKKADEDKDSAGA